jgi:hypothetical protein
MNVLCLITFRPNSIWLDFLKNFINYQVFVIVDDNEYDLSLFQNTYTNITFIKISEDQCKLHGYIDTNFMIGKLISGWDKALYYFTCENTNFDFIWFFEDDVFFYNEETILKMDCKYRNEDLISSTYYENPDGNRDDWNWHWKHIHVNYSPPYYNGMMCAVRFSKRMMNNINNYASTYKTLFFLEALFPTIAIKNNLYYTTPEELVKIYYRHNFQINEITVDCLYHPVKDLNMHSEFRELL